MTVLSLEPASAQAQTPPEAKPGLRDARECTAREGLPNFFAKAASGQAVKVGYLGGSITAQEGWRVRSLQWFRDQFPGAKFEGINAAIGGTGSELGVFRMKSDVLDKKPDLLFVEFAVNDAYTPPAILTRAVEGIVRQTWALLPDTDICFVYTLTQRDSATYQTGKLPQSATVMEAVADRYGIPSIAFGVEVSRLEGQGKLIMASPDAHVERVSGEELNVDAHAGTGPILFSKDGVHPYLDTGHALYTQALIRSMQEIRSCGTAEDHSLGSPIDGANWQNARLVALDDTRLFDGEVVQLDPKLDPMAAKFSQRLPGMWKLSPGARLRFKFKGTKASLYGLLSPDSGNIEVAVDGKSRKVSLFDSYTTYPRLGLFSIGDGLEDREHEVTVTVLADSPDKEAILPEAKKNEYRKDPSKFSGTNFYLGALLLVGDLTGPVH